MFDGILEESGKEAGAKLFVFGNVEKVEPRNVELGTEKIFGRFEGERGRRFGMGEGEERSEGGF